MTFGYGSPGFDPFYCPPCPGAAICNQICIDPIDGPLFLLSVFLGITVLEFMVMVLYTSFTERDIDDQ